MKKFSFILCAMMMVIAGCDDANNDEGEKDDTKCSESVCKDANTLSFCNPATNKSEDITCPFGCNAAQKKCNTQASQPSQCTANVCNGDTLIVCMPDGSTVTQACPFGCDGITNACKTSNAPATPCTESKCVGDTLNFCDNGVMTPIPCKFGCDATKNVCKTQQTTPAKCTETVCSGNNLIVCQADGTTKAELCPNGCDAVKKECKSGSTTPTDPQKCTETKCDGNNLIVCNANGTTTTQNCPNGCDAVKKECKSGSTTPTDPQKCTESKCDGNNLIQCNANGTTTTLNCPNGCDAVKKECKAGSTTPTDLDIKEVPASQNNKKDAPCEYTKFVEHCDGNKVVYCAEDYIGDESVDIYDCAADGGVCAITSVDGYNYANCVDPKGSDICPKVGNTDEYCDYDYEGYEVKSHEGCYKYTDGKLHWTWLGYTYCSNLCEDGCKQIKCDMNKDDTCSSDKTYTQECYGEDANGNSIYLAYDCAYENAVCYVDEGMAGCK